MEVIDCDVFHAALFHGFAGGLKPFFRVRRCGERSGCHRENERYWRVIVGCDFLHISFGEGGDLVSEHLRDRSPRSAAVAGRRLSKRFRDIHEWQHKKTDKNCSASAMSHDESPLISIE